MPHEKPRIALLGAGRHSRSNHAAALARLAREEPGEVELAAVCDLDPKRAESVAAGYGFARAYTDMHEMMAKESPDGCIAVMPVERIVPVALELLRYRVPLVVEKPPGRTPQECAQLRDAAAAAGVPVQVSVNRRFQPLLARGLAWAREQGPLHYVAASMLRAERREAEFVTGTAVHVIDALRHIAGEVVSYQFRHGRGREHGQAWFLADLEFAGGLAGVLCVHPDCGMVAERYELRGEGFSVEVQLGPLCPYELRCRRGNRDVIADSLPAEAPAEIASGAYEEMRAFVRGIREGLPPAALHPSLDEVAPSVALAHEIQKRLDHPKE
jgi:predicted dehydrogenase